MAQTLVVCRVGTQWAFRDVTGAFYGHSSELHSTMEFAQHMAARAGSHVVLSAEADEALRSSTCSKAVVSGEAAEKKSRRRFGLLWARLGQARRRK